MEGPSAAVLRSVEGPYLAAGGLMRLVLGVPKEPEDRNNHRFLAARSRKASLFRFAYSDPCWRNLTGSPLANRQSSFTRHQVEGWVCGWENQLTGRKW